MGSHPKGSGELSPESFLQFLSSYFPCQRLIIALSGGTDSTALLDLLVKARELGLLPMPLVALHINHQLQSTAEQWQTHCAELCKDRDITFVTHTLDICSGSLSQHGVEAAAREARYKIFTETLKQGDILLTAHHRDDQLETLLGRLMRGCGVKGASGMASVRELGEGRVVRALLKWGRSDIDAYLNTQGLTVIDDPSNRDETFQRNYIRHRLLPPLKGYGRGVEQNIERAMGHFQEADQLLTELAAIDANSSIDADGSLRCAPLRGLSPPRVRNLLRYWLQRHHYLPQRRQLDQMMSDLIDAKQDAEPRFCWQGGEIRRFGDALYQLPPLPRDPIHYQIGWKGEGFLHLPEKRGSVFICKAEGKGVRIHSDDNITLRSRQGGERLQLPGHNGHSALKKLYQQARIPPWERELRPLIFSGDDLIGVAGLWSSMSAAVVEGEIGYHFNWQLHIEK